MDGASVIEDTWLRARAGEHGYLSGKDAEAVACDALIVPVVTGSPNWTVISQVISYSDPIPEPIRRAVIMRDKHCAGPAAATAAPPSPTSTTSPT